MDDRYLEILRTYWGYDHFRGIQEDIIASIGDGRDTLGLMPTGGGKSVTFQVPALARPGVCLVITPLIALMKDQVAQLRRRGIKAAALYSGLTREEAVVLLENCIYGDYKFLYISPERLSAPLFLAKLPHIPVSFITVDEAHCISQWGYDFRPAYTRIADIRRLLPDCPVLALTATATPEVVDDIQQQLAFRAPNVFRMSFDRPNLSYIVRTTDDKESQLRHMLDSLSGSVIIYARSRKGSRELAAWLTARGYSATYYHAGLSQDEKDRRQQSWTAGAVRIMVATNAFGMGIDKPDVRLVLHLDLPDSPEAYFQEAGRAGRDGQTAYAVLLYSPSDRTRLTRRIADTFPDRAFIATVYEHLCYYYQMAMGDGLHVMRPFDLAEFCRNFRHFPVPVESALRLLSRAGYIDYAEEQEYASRLMFLVRRDELYRIPDADPQLEQVVHEVLRTYGGLFSDYIYIDEARLARASGLSRDQIYQSLLALSRRRILHYIPYRRTAFITFTRRRVGREQLVLPPAVYEQRRAGFEKRIRAMADYAASDDCCRSRMLLAYFGQTDAADCGRCDVCRRRRQNNTSGTIQ